MTVTLRIDPAQTMRFHVALAEALQVRGFDVVIAWGDGARAPQRGIAAVMKLEDLLYASRPAPLTAPAAVADFPQSALSGSDATAPLLLDLTGAADQARDDRFAQLWRLLFDDSPAIAALFSALLNGRAPLLTLENSDGKRIAHALPALEHPQRLGLCADHVLARAIDLIMAAVAGASTAMQSARAHETPKANGLGAAGFFASSLAGRIRTRFRKYHGQTPRWQVGYRRLEGDNDGTRVSATQHWPSTDYVILPDDGARYYADPFPVSHEGRDYLFVEEFPHATGKGILSVCEIAADGTASTPRPCLESETHLSYPQIFRHGDDWWMIPESCAAGRLDLFRAVAFPWRWEFYRTLIEGAAISDATLMRHEGQYWLLGTVAAQGRSTWDALHAWRAPGLFGPWTPHRKNPLLIDASCARPAGNVVIEKGKILRPVQNCVGGYGAGLALAEITRLDEQDFDQRIVAALKPDPRWRATGVHTLNSSARYEAIDFFA